MLAAVVGWLQRLRRPDLPSSSVRTQQTDIIGPARPLDDPGKGKSGARRGKRWRKGRGGPREMLKQICGYLNDDGFRYHLRASSGVIETGFRARSGTFPMVIFLREEPAVLGVLVRLADVVPEARRPEMAEAISRANYGLSLGCFELDMSDGEMDFRIAMPTGGATVSREQLRALLGAAMWTTSRYHRAFARLLYGDDLSPAEVIAEVEMADGDQGRED